MYKGVGVRFADFIFFFFNHLNRIFKNGGGGGGAVRGLSEHPEPPLVVVL